MTETTSTLASEEAAAADTESVRERIPARETETDYTVMSRYGEIAVNKDVAISFPHGVLGFSEDTLFGLCNLPNSSEGSFKILQSLHDGALSFVVLPIPYENELIVKPDLDQVCQDLGCNPANIALLLIVTVRGKPEGGASLTANVQAPIFMDLSAQKAWQVILENEYPVQLELPTE